MKREETVDFLECRRAYYTSLSTDPSPYVKATKVCGYTLAESANACLRAIKALEQETVLDKIRAEINVGNWRIYQSRKGEIQMLEHLKYHCKHNEAKPNGSVSITVAAFDTESAAMEFVKNNPQYDVDEIWFMENQDGTWVPAKTVWTKEQKKL